MSENQKYLRAPFMDTSIEYGHELFQYNSPNAEHTLTVSHKLTYEQGKSIYLFNLENRENIIVENFAPLVTSGKSVWSEDSNWLAIEVGIDKVGYLVVDVLNLIFAFIPFRRRPAATVSFQDRVVNFEMPNNFIEVLNAAKLFGGGESELPRIKYEKAEDLKIRIDQLEFFGKDKLPNLFDDMSNAIRFEPQRNGFWPFEGRLPQDTETGYNGRAFEIYQLETFAEYGDKVAKKWLDMIVEKAEGNYQLYKPVKDYLGLLHRKDFLD